MIRVIKDLQMFTRELGNKEVLKPNEDLVVGQFFISKIRKLFTSPLVMWVSLAEHSAHRKKK